MVEFATHFVDYAIFLCYSFLLWQTLSAWRCLRCRKNNRNASTLTALLLLMVISILAFVSANAYMLQFRGETLLTMRIFQIFVIGNFVVYQLILILLRKEAEDGHAA